MHNVLQVRAVGAGQQGIGQGKLYRGGAGDALGAAAAMLQHWQAQELLLETLRVGCSQGRFKLLDSCKHAMTDKFLCRRARSDPGKLRGQFGGVSDNFIFHKKMAWALSHGSVYSTKFR